MRKRKKYQPTGYSHMSHREFVIVEDIIKNALERESGDLRTYSDLAMAALISDQGIVVSQQDVRHHRWRLGIPGSPTRLRNLLKERGVKK